MVAARQASKKKPRTYARLPRDAEGEGPRHRAHRHARPLARAADDRGRRGRRRRLRAEADQRGRRRRPGDARRGAQAQARGAGRHAAPQHAAPDRGPRPASSSEGKLGKIGLVEIYCYYHMRARGNPPDIDAARVPRLRDVDRPRADAAVQPAGAPAAAGGRSWNTATASWATCASTCSTWCAGCWTWAGRKRIASTGGILVRQGEQGEHHRHADGHVRLRRPAGRLAAPHLGRVAPTRSIPWGATFYGDKGTLKASVMRLRLHPAWARASRAHPQGRGLRVRAVPRGQDREGPGEARRPGHPRAHEGLPGARSHRAASRWPTSSRATSPRRAASWPTWRCRPAARSPGTRRSTASPATTRRTGCCAALPQALGASGSGAGVRPLA